MIDLKHLRENPQDYRKACELKRSATDFDAFLALDAKGLSIRQKLQELATQKNEASKSIAKIKDPAERKDAIENMSRLKEHQKKLNTELAQLEPRYQEMLLQIPQPADPQAPVGLEESDNVEVRQVGAVREFDFEPKDHVELGSQLEIIDIERGVKLSGSRNYVLRGDGALLHNGVLRLAFDLLIGKGYEPLTVPVLTRESTFIGTGWFPEGKSQVYEVPGDELFLVGTAEVPATSLYMDEILDESELPKQFVAQSICFRREAGAAGKDTYGLYRIHQFEKVEQVIVCRADREEARQWHEKIMANAEEVLVALELPYRVIDICTGEMGQGKYRMYDIETWMPSRGGYCETHSASNLLDFQARRLNLRYRDASGKIRYCYTLNNTVIASPRILISLLELNQNRDGSINIPAALQPYMQGREKIS